MGNRLLNMQRQVRELGRLRTGYTGPRGPVRSKTWIVTSAQRECLDVAAELWGGTVERWTPQNGSDQQWKLTTERDTLEGFLPPGDPLTQANEMWNRGGATRRCNGEVESKSGQPCLCRAQFGEEYYRRTVREVCKPYSQLNVMLLQLPDLGVWRHVTKSFYAAGEIAGMVDLIKAQVGVDVMVPIRLRIDQRKKVADGTTTPYPVPVIEIRGASAGQILAGDVPSLAVTAGPQRQALAAAPAATVAPDVESGRRKLTEAQVLTLAGDLKTIEALQELWRAAAADKVLTDDVKAVLTKCSGDIQNAAQAANQPAPTVTVVDEVVDAVIVDDSAEGQRLWTAVMEASPFDSMTQLNGDFQKVTGAGHNLDDATSDQLAEYLKALQARAAA